MISLTESSQALFARRWSHLQDPHVRALAWLLDAPDLLDPAAPQWGGLIASLGPHCGEQAAEWLSRLDAAPTEFHARLGLGATPRLGRYAEKLIATYFAQQGTLVAHGLQVQAGKSATIGEFDFLLREGATLLHWEFATKFYLLEGSGAGQAADYFVGPNLADTLGAKMGKILHRQLALGQHPAAQTYLPQPISRAQALVKGWLFYHPDQTLLDNDIGLHPQHCRGFWCALNEWHAAADQACLRLERLDWLAPASVQSEQCCTADQLRTELAAHFAHDSMPVLVALLADRGGKHIEIERGFIVPNDWRERAGQRRLQQIN